MAHDPRIPADDPAPLSTDETLVERDVVVATGTGAALPPTDVDEVQLIRQDERITVEPDGAIRREVDRVEQRTHSRNPLVPALLILLALVAVGLAAAWYFTRDEQQTIPSVEGLQLDRAITRLQDDGFKTAVVSRASDEPAGVVFEQQPAGGETADEGSTVTVVSSEGPATVPIPNAVGLDEAAARDRIAAAGLIVRVVEVYSDVPEGEVTAQNPRAGEQAAQGSTIRINVSRGTGQVAVPSLVGTSEDAAVSTLEAAGLTANVVRVPSVELAGTVVAQNPTAGTVREGSAVRLNVSRGTP